MKNKEHINNIRVELDQIKVKNSDREALQVYEVILLDLEKDIIDLQNEVVARIEGIL